ncbi:MAG: DUF1428 domain-containing protein [Pseudomonadota bacterium]
MTYVDGFVAAVPTENKQAYLEHAKACVPVFKKYGAIRLVETWGVDVPDGETTSFPMAVKCKPDETVVLAWIVWPSKEARDVGMQEAERDPFFADEGNSQPFDGSRMIFGGFETILDE